MERQDANNLTVTNVIIGAGELEVDGVNVGFTEGGVTFAYERTFIEIEADQAICDIARRKIKEVLTISTTLLEATLTNLRLVWGLTGTIQNLGDGTTQLNFGCEATCDEPSHVLLFSGPGPNCMTRYVEIYDAFSLESGEHTYAKGGAVKVPVVFKAIADRTRDAGNRYGNIRDTEDPWTD